eukprot:CAMPEP_0202969440 /NCGR_PEP_ID=MMETSP1396-20130829/15174_1 /ASSEMBLY_ACC=CAM_ASM_000872 /TAXON_ID= /ORGANISM="Pseudokeronopsis sp., Strain Brazil" /LENGTH=95 /DNA_ID=CAMNT_0049696979 /DNA_START=133 /DNA_END=420 /DNA_ORIENTATION=-
MQRAVESSKDISQLYSSILERHFLGESSLTPEQRSDVFQELLIPEIQKQFKAINQSHPDFTNMFLEFIGNEKLRFGNLIFLIKESLIKEVVPRIA